MSLPKGNLPRMNAGSFWGELKGIGYLYLFANRMQNTFIKRGKMRDSTLVEISSEFVRISSELVRISSELVRISSELVKTSLELILRKKELKKREERWGISGGG